MMTDVMDILGLNDATWDSATATASVTTDRDAAFAFAFDLEYGSPKQDATERTWKDSKQIIQALNGMNAELREECGKKSKVISELQRSKQHAIMEIATALEEERRKTRIVEEYAASLETAMECCQSQIKDVEARYAALSSAISHSAATACDIVTEHGCKKQEKHDAIYHRYFRSTVEVNWEQDVSTMIEEFRDKSSGQTNVYNRSIRDLEAIVCDAIRDLDITPIFIYYAYTRVQLEQATLLCCIYVITKHSIYEFQKKTPYPLIGTTSYLGQFRQEYQLPTYIIPCATTSLVKEDYQLVKYKKIAHLAIPIIQQYVVSQKYIETPMHARTHRIVESVKKSVKRMTIMCDTLVNMCCA